MYALAEGRSPGGQVNARSQFRDVLLRTPGSASEPCDNDEAALYRTGGQFFEAECATCVDSRQAWPSTDVSAPSAADSPPWIWKL